MGWWQLAVVGTAVVLAVHGLFSLMTRRRHELLKRLIDAEVQRREREAAARQLPDE